MAHNKKSKLYERLAAVKSAHTASRLLDPYFTGPVGQHVVQGHGGGHHCAGTCSRVNAEPAAHHTLTGDVNQVGQNGSGRTIYLRMILVKS